MAECEQCGQCCTYMEFPLAADTDGYFDWIAWHGVKIVFSHGLFCARIEQPCFFLVDGKCNKYKTRPKMCRDYMCERKDR